MCTMYGKICLKQPLKNRQKRSYSQNELSSSIAANFCPTIFFSLDFHFYVIFLLIGIGQLDNDVLKK